jgi:hypothetical protein
VIWTLRVEPIDDTSCRFVNRVTARATDAFLAFLEEHGQTFERAAAARQEATAAHVRLETPLYAQSIARAARTVAV